MSSKFPKPSLHVATSDEWTQLLSQCEGDYALSQTFEFGAAISRAYPEYSHVARIAEFADGARVLLPLIQVQSRLFRVLDAMPLSLQGMPIGINASPAHLRAAVQEVDADRFDLNAGAKAVEGKPEEMQREFDFDGEVIEGETHVLDLGGGFEALWTGTFSRKLRKECRAAIKHGVECFDATTAQEFDDYYELYLQTTQRWGYEVPPYPRALFHELATLRRTKPGQCGVQLKLARVEGEVVSGMVLFHGKRSVLAWSTAMKRQSITYSPYKALLHALISEACEGECQIFDLGASGSLASARYFKELFGARPVCFWNFSRQSARYKFAATVRQRLKQMPQPAKSDEKTLKEAL